MYTALILMIMSNYLIFLFFKPTLERNIILENESELDKYRMMDDNIGIYAFILAFLF